MEPATGIVDANSAYASAAKPHATEAMMNDTISAGPACTAPVPVSTKMPVPMIAPMPRKVRSSAPSVFFKPAACAPAIMCSTFFLRKRDMLGRGLLVGERGGRRGALRRNFEEPAILADVAAPLARVRLDGCG